MANETANSDVLNEIVKSNVPKLTVCARLGDEQIKENKQISNLHYHDELEFLPIWEGEFCCYADGKEYIAKTGEVLFVNARTPHSTRTVVPARMGMLQFREKDFVDSELDEIVKYSIRFRAMSSEPVKIIRDPELFDLIRDILKECAERKPAYDFFIRAGIYKLLGILYRLGVLESREGMYSSPELKKIIPALLYINKNYTEELDLSHVSRLTGFDPSYFCRVFKKATGATFTEYLNFVRICKAESLLGKSEKSILEISEDVGFSSISYFNRTFKKFLGCSPGQYRTAKYVKISSGEIYTAEQ